VFKLLKSVKAADMTVKNSDTGLQKEGRIHPFLAGRLGVMATLNKRTYFV
jgi:hypothetical protein